MMILPKAVESESELELGKISDCAVGVGVGISKEVVAELESALPRTRESYPEFAKYSQSESVFTRLSNFSLS